MGLWRRLKDYRPWSRAPRERELEREIQSHLELEAEEKGPYGSRRTFGNELLVLLCALVAVLLIACVNLANQRRSEIGVRMALGATPHDILFSFGRRGLALTLGGLGIGVVLASVAARAMATLFYGFRPDYAPAVAVVSLVLLAVAALASLVPARRASRIDPIRALQHE